MTYACTIDCVDRYMPARRRDTGAGPANFGRYPLTEVSSTNDSLSSRQVEINENERAPQESSGEVIVMKPPTIGNM
jgi:hypothetical protein